MSLPDPVPVYLALLVALDRHQLRQPKKLGRVSRQEIINALDAIWNMLDEAQMEALERRYTVEVQPLFPQPCPPDCEGCAADVDLREDLRVNAATDEARRRRVPVDPEPRHGYRLRPLVPVTRPKRGTRKPRSKDHRR